MDLDDISYLSRRAGMEREVAEQVRDPYVKACHRRLAIHYERAVADFLEIPRDWPIDRLRLRSE